MTEEEMKKNGIVYRAPVNDFLEVARANGRGVVVFRPDEAAAFLGVSDVVIRDAMSDYVRSSGRRGLAHFSAGKGSLIRRCALDTWMDQQEQTTAKRGA